VPDSPFDATRARGCRVGCKARWSAGLVPASAATFVQHLIFGDRASERSYVDRSNWVFSRNVLCLYLTIVCRAETFSIEQTSTGLRRLAWVFLRWIDAAIHSLSHCGPFIEFAGKGRLGQCEMGECRTCNTVVGFSYQHEMLGSLSTALSRRVKIIDCHWISTNRCQLCVHQVATILSHQLRSFGLKRRVKTPKLKTNHGKSGSFLAPWNEYETMATLCGCMAQLCVKLYLNTRKCDSARFFFNNAWLRL
jgi:hypothetical protein